MAPSPSKRPKVAHSNGPKSVARPTEASPSRQPSLRDLFAKSVASAPPRDVQLQRPSCQGKEKEELEWAIQASLREAEAVAAAGGGGAEKESEAHRVSVVPGEPSKQPSPVDDTLLDVDTNEDKSATTPRPLQPLQNRTYETEGGFPAHEGTSGTNVEASIKTDASAKESTVVAVSEPPVKNAFSKLMSSHSEAKEWANADVVEQRNYAGGARSRPQRRTAPFYKVLTGMPISVDAFRFGEVKGCTAYFLSHFHADHYGGLTSTWTHGPVYCSQTTANLVRSSLYVNEMHICPIPMNTPTVIPKTGGVRVTLLDANHCPGSCLFLFEGPQTQHILPTPAGTPHPALPPPSVTFRYLHCGDFRASPRHTNHPLIKGKRLDIIYLDTTYCNPRYCFPAQEMVVAACAERVRLAAPEQCAEGQRRRAEKDMEPEEDWRKAPLQGKRLEAARQAESHRKSGEALQGWLDGEANVKVETEPTVKEEDEPSVKDEEEFGDMDFRDEELGFQRDESNSLDGAEDGDEGEQEEDQAAQRNGASGLARAADDSSTRSPEQRAACLPQLDRESNDGNHSRGAPSGSHEADDLPEAQGCDDGAAPLPPLKREESNMDDLEVDERAGLGENFIKTISDEAKPPPAPREDARKTKVASVKPEASPSDNFPRVLVVVGTYTIGKEKVVLGCAQALGTKIYCADKRKYRVYAQLEDAELHSLLTRDPRKAYVHVTSLMSINGDALKEHTARMRADGMRIDRAIAFRPTGWTYRPPMGMDVVSPSLERLVHWNQNRAFGAGHLFPTRDSTPQYAIYGVPYSEHSSFFELTAFCLSVDYNRIIATVNVGSPNSRAKMARWMEKWKAEKKRRGGIPIDPRSVDFF